MHSEMNRRGRRNQRRTNSRKPELGYYIIITDAEETEKNYFNGLREALPDPYKQKIVIKTKKTETRNLVNSAINELQDSPNYAQPWIVFDRDRVTNFDQIIEEAQKKHIEVGWSNPCFEIWFFAYFGKMPNLPTSVECCRRFNILFRQKCGNDYKKSDPLIYEKLKNYGDISLAIDRAKQRYKELISSSKGRPSTMISCTSIYSLIEEIRHKIALN